jgi:Winged helix-turn helix
MSAVPVAVRRTRRRVWGVTDPVGVDVGGLGGAGDEDGQGVVHGQPGPDLLANQVQQPRAQDPAGAAQMDLELIVRGFLFPTIMVGGGQLIGAGGGGVDDRGQQHDQFPGAVAFPVGHVVLDHPHQVRFVGVQVSRCRLDEARLARLAAELDAGPAAHGWVEDQRWTLPRVTVLIGRLFHVTYTERGVSYLLHRIGWTPQVRVHRAAERDEAAIATWREETWSRVR